MNANSDAEESLRLKALGLAVIKNEAAAIADHGSVGPCGLRRGRRVIIFCRRVQGVHRTRTSVRVLAPLRGGIMNWRA